MTWRVIVGLALMISGTAAHGYQAPSPAAGQDKTVSLHADSMDISEAVKFLFDAAGKKYRFDTDVSGSVSVDLHHVPFQTALETVLLESSRHLTYRVEDGVYHILPSGESAGGFRVPTPNQYGDIVSSDPTQKIVAFYLNYARPSDLVRSFQTDKKSLVPPRIAFAAGSHSRIIVKYEDEDDLRKLKELIRILDVPPLNVELRLELVLMSGGANTVRHSIVRLVGRTDSEKPLTLRTTLNRRNAHIAGGVVEGGELSFRSTPRLLGDSSIQLDTDFTLDLTVRPDRGQRLARLQRKTSGNIRISTGKTVAVARSTFASAQGEDEAILYVTPRWIRNPEPVSTFTMLSVRPLLVVDFQGDDEIKQALPVIMASSDRWEVLRESEITRAAETLGFKRPFDTYSQDRLCDQLQADVYVTGEVKPIPRHSERLLTVLMRDVKTGAVRTADAMIPVSKSETAVMAAVRDVVYRLECFHPVEGAVLAAIGPSKRKTALVNLGTADSVSVGSELLVVTDGRKIGKLRVIRTSATDCEAEIIEGGNVIRPEDAVQVYVKGRYASVQAPPSNVRP